MNEIVYAAADGDLVTDTAMIAANTTNSHESVIKLVRTYLADLESFGRVRFEIRPFETPGGEQTREVALLDEPQSTLLISYMRNNEIVRAFKMKLVRGFMAMRQQLRSLPDPLAGLPADKRALIGVMIENEAIKKEQAVQAVQIANQAEAIKRIESNQTAAVASVQNFTALGFSIYREIPMSKIELIRLGKRASAISKRKGITIDHVADGRHGRVGSYHISVLDEALEELTK